MASCNANLSKLRKDAESIFHAGLKAVNAETAVLAACRRKGNHLGIHSQSFDLDDAANVYVVGAGKASADMGAALEKLLGDRITAGAITVKYHHTRPLDRIALFEAGHPVPDENGLAGASRIAEIADMATQSDLVICLLSGGGSALLPLPAASLTLSDKQETIQALLSCGAGINEINALRKHMSAIKGGRLAERAFPATVATLIVSDVVGDKPDVIASGPTVADTSTFSACLRIIESYNLKNRLPAAVYNHMAAGAAGRLGESPKAESAVFSKTHNFIIASSRTALAQAREKALSLGYQTVLLSSMIEGETREVARMHAAIAREARQSGNPAAPPACLLSGGETTVTISGSGKGGRNQEFALAAALEISDDEGIVILSGGTDGTDGPTDAAGAVVDSQTVARAIAAGLSPRLYLQENDAYNFFSQTGELLITGPTGTNVMDLRLMLIG